MYYIRTSMRRKIVPLIVLYLLTAGCSGRYETLQAESGEYNLIELDESAEEISFSVNLGLTRYDSDAEWPTAAYAGVYQGRNTNDSVQFFISKDRPSDSHLIAGYRVIEFGQQVRRVNLSKLQLDQKAQVNISFVRGLVTVSMQGVEPVTIETELDVVKPYISVSSGAASFSIDV